MISYRLEHLSDRELLDGLARVTREVRRHVAEILAHLAEVDRRRLYLEQGCSSLFAYAVEILHFSEDEAGKRIQAARVARDYPVVFEMLASGELHLTAVNLLAPHLTADSHARLLAAARHKSKRHVEELVAAHAPRPDAVTRLARLPAARVAGASPWSPNAGEATGTETGSSGPSGVASAVLGPGASAPATAGGVGAGAGSSPARPGPRPSVKPLAPGRYRLQLTLSDEGHRALLRARDLMRHQNPSGDLAVVVERAIVALAGALESRKLGKLKQREGRDSAARGAARGDRATPEVRPAPGERAPEQTPQPPADRTSRGSSGDRAVKAHVPEHVRARRRSVGRELRRRVAERDDARCTFVSSSGHRCAERGFLELHHTTPVAHGGAGTVDGLVLLCRAHHRLVTLRDFGEPHVRRCVEQRSAARGPPP